MFNNHPVIRLVNSRIEEKKAEAILFYDKSVTEARIDLASQMEELLERQNAERVAMMEKYERALKSIESQAADMVLG